MTSLSNYLCGQMSVCHERNTASLLNKHAHAIGDTMVLVFQRQANIN